MRDLTERQREALTFMLDHCVEHMRPPTIREIGAKMGIPSTNGVGEHLRALVRKGYVVQQSANAQRGMWPVRDVEGAPISWRLSYERSAS